MNAAFAAMDASFPPKLLSFALAETTSVVVYAIFVTSLASFAHLAASIFITRFVFYDLAVP